MRTTLTKTESKRLLGIDASKVEIWRGVSSKTFAVLPSPTLSVKFGMLVGLLLALPGVLFGNKSTWTQLKDNLIDGWGGDIELYEESESRYCDAETAYYSKLDND